LIHAVLWLPLTIGMSLALIQPIKGALVGLQWAQRMHGFKPAESDGDMLDGDMLDGDMAPSRVIEPRR
jgi:hypothetical protein